MAALSAPSVETPPRTPLKVSMVRGPVVHPLPRCSVSLFAVCLWHSTLKFASCSRRSQVVNQSFAETVPVAVLNLLLLFCASNAKSFYAKLVIQHTS